MVAPLAETVVLLPLQIVGDAADAVTLTLETVSCSVAVTGQPDTEEVYVIVVVPSAIAVIKPVVGFIVATPVLELDQVPPATEAVHVVVLPAHKEIVPVSVGAGVILNSQIE